jgi:hypothetical protein
MECPNLRLKKALDNKDPCSEDYTKYLYCQVSRALSDPSSKVSDRVELLHHTLRTRRFSPRQSSKLNELSKACIDVN